MPCNVNDPVSSCGLLFVASLVLFGGVGVVNVAAMALSLGPHGVAMGVEVRFGIEDSSAGGTDATLVARIDDIGRPYLTELGPPVALFGPRFFFGWAGCESLPLGSLDLLEPVLFKPACGVAELLLLAFGSASAASVIVSWVSSVLESVLLSSFAAVAFAGLFSPEPPSPIF